MTTTPAEPGAPQTGRPEAQSAAIAVLSMVNLDCADPQALGSFYSAVLGWPVTYSDADYAMISGGHTSLGFGRVPGYAPPAWPDTDSSKRYHLDLQVADLAAGTAACVDLGATVPDAQPGEGKWRVLLDPAGHPFCLSPARSAS